MTGVDDTGETVTGAAAPGERRPPASRIVELPGAFRTWCGDTVPGVRVAYESWGEPAGDGSNTLVVFTGLSPSAHAASCERDPSPGWWEAMIGPGRALDTNRFHVLCFNSLGSCFGSTGPASLRPDGEGPWQVDFPELRIEDMATAAALALDEFGYSRVHGIVGPSMGGMTALAFLLRHPGRARHLLSISSAVGAAPFAIAVRSLQREIVRYDPQWQEGRYPPEQPPVGGMRMARKLGMASYRSPQEWAQRFGREKVEKPDPGFGPRFQIESYLAAHADKFVGGFDPNCYLYLSRAMDLFDVADHGQDRDEAMARLHYLESACVLGVESDILFPLEQQKALARGLEGAGVGTEFHALPCIQGHDAFLADTDSFAPVVADYLRRI